MQGEHLELADGSSWFADDYLSSVSSHFGLVSGRFSGVIGNISCVRGLIFCARGHIFYVSTLILIEFMGYGCEF